MNAAVLMFTACLAGQGPAPMPYAPAPMPYAQAPVVVYPNQGYAAPGYGQGHGHHFGHGFGSHGHCFGLNLGGHGFGHGANNCCGHASVDCCGEDKCCLLKKIKDKICCVKIRITCEKKESCGDHGPRCHNPCPSKPVCHNPCPPKPVCNPCPPKPVCCPKPVCEKPTCCKVEPTCHKPCTTLCWTPGYCLHKCKEKLSGLCNFGGCHGGCGTAATPNACGSTVIAPAPGTVVPPTATPVAPKAMPDAKKLQSNYGPVRPELTPVAGTAPRVIDLTANPF